MGFASRGGYDDVDRELRELRRWPRAIRYSLVGVAVVLVGALGWTLGSRAKAATSGDALASIEAKQREHADRLAVLRTEIADAEKRAVEARREAALERCHAEAARIDAAVAAKAASCVREQAAVSACHARNEMSKGESMKDGCAAGALAALFTGGSALLFMGGGCLLGEAAGESNASECPVSSCAEAVDRWMSEAAATLERKGMPICELGAEVVETKLSFDGGLFVREALLGAAAAGVKPGDIIVEVKSTRTRTINDLEVALAGASPGSRLDIQFIRDGARRKARVQITARSNAAPGSLLGVRAEPIETVPCVETRVVSIDREAGFGLAVGDVIEGVGSQMSMRAAELAGAFRAGHPSLAVRRKGRVVTLPTGAR